MSAGESDRVQRVVLRVVNGVSTETELQNGQSGKAELVAESFHFLIYDAKIFRNDGRVTQFPFQRVEKRGTRSRNPFAVARGFVFCGNRPKRLKAAEVIYAKQVKMLEGEAKAVDPPAI